MCTMKNMNADQFMFIKISVLYDAVANESVAHGIPVSQRALDNDICPHLLRVIISSWQDEYPTTENSTTRAVKPSVKVW